MSSGRARECRIEKPQACLETMMPTEKIGEYEIEYSGVALPDGAGWAAHAAVFGASHNPMHRNVLFSEQRVAADAVFQSQAEAESEARRFAVEMIEARPRH
jgi:hypothetical protein